MEILTFLLEESPRKIKELHEELVIEKVFTAAQRLVLGYCRYGGLFRHHLLFGHCKLTILVF